jgi:uncharacterized Zn finger protein (UPF0148 family)
MSDFDKEAERRKLREKYEKDREKRVATQRMSELLLKGATMTNKHCDVCGDPLFRYNGEEFCATCRGEGRDARAASSEATDGQRGDASAAASPDSTGADSEPEQGGTESADGETAGVASSAETATQGSASAESRDSSAVSPATRAGGSEASARRSDAREVTGSASLDDARTALVRSITRFAREAETTDDPRRAKELLAAAREAAETLAALRR